MAGGSLHHVLHEATFSMFVPTLQFEMKPSAKPIYHPLRPRIEANAIPPKKGNGGEDVRLAALFAQARQPLTLSTRKRIAVQVSEGIDFLHSRSPCFMHGDVKSFDPQYPLMGAFSKVSKQIVFCTSKFTRFAVEEVVKAFKVLCGSEDERGPRSHAQCKACRLRFDTVRVPSSFCCRMSRSATIVLWWFLRINACHHGYVTALWSSRARVCKSAFFVPEAICEPHYKSFSLVYGAVNPSDGGLPPERF